MERRVDSEVKVERGLGCAEKGSGAEEFGRSDRGVPRL